jgi:hypothetical protein
MKNEKKSDLLAIVEIKINFKHTVGSYLATDPKPFN